MSQKSGSPGYKLQNASNPCMRICMAVTSNWHWFKASAIQFCEPALYLITKEKDYKYLTHLACLAINLCCPLMYFNATWSENNTNSFVANNYAKYPNIEQRKIKLFHIRRILPPCIVQFFAKEGYWPLILTNNSTESNTRCITFNLKNVSKIW